MLLALCNSSSLRLLINHWRFFFFFLVVNTYSTSQYDRNNLTYRSTKQYKNSLNHTNKNTNVYRAVLDISAKWAILDGKWKSVSAKSFKKSWLSVAHIASTWPVFEPKSSIYTPTLSACRLLLLSSFCSLLCFLILSAQTILFIFVLFVAWLLLFNEINVLGSVLLIHMLND